MLWEPPLSQHWSSLEQSSIFGSTCTNVAASPSRELPYTTSELQLRLHTSNHHRCTMLNTFTVAPPSPEVAIHSRVTTIAYLEREAIPIFLQQLRTQLLRRFRRHCINPCNLRVTSHDSQTLMERERERLL